VAGVKRILDRAVDYLAPAGFLVVVGAYWWQRSGRVLPVREEWFLGAGLLLAALQVALRWDRVVARLGRRQMKYGTNMAVLLLGALAILGLVNYLVVRNSKRWDLTKGQRYSLSDQSKKILAGLKDDVKIVYFQRSAEMEGGRERLREYEAASPRVKVEYVDPLKNPARAQAYDARGPWPVIVVERGDKRERVSNDSEQDLTNSFVKVTRQGRKTVCFAYGEGERDIEDSGDGGYTAAKAALGRSQYETRKVLMAREADVPADCTVLVIPGPENDLLPTVVDAVRRYVKGGGKAMVMVEPAFKHDYPNLVGLLKEWNLETAKDVVVDVSPMGQLFGTGPLTPIAAQYPYHEITKDFRVTTAFHTARSLKAGTASVAGVFAQNLLETSPASWAETDLGLKEVRLDDGTDQPGPVSLGAVVTVQASGAGSPAGPPPPGPLVPLPSPPAAATPSPAAVTRPPSVAATPRPPAPARPSAPVATTPAPPSTTAPASPPPTEPPEPPTPEPPPPPTTQPPAVESPAAPAPEPSPGMAWLRGSLGPLPLAVAAAAQAAETPSASPSPEEASAPKREGRVAAFGDADFASNALLGFQGNQDFFLNTVAWLAEDADLISIRPREPEDQRLFLTRAQQQNVALVALVLLPGVFVALGIWSWWKRR
jgi:ABC-type uncharacterized transport system involved in gliding motility auxiliary subunit